MAEGAFAEAVTDFDASVLHATNENVCPMQPEVIEDEPGNCPSCGMKLVAREPGASGENSGADAKDQNHNN